MATPDQIKTVKTIRRRLIELLGDSRVTVTVSYTSASDMLRLTFKKLLKGATFELPICTSMKEYLLNPETLQYIVTDALAKMPQPPKWTMETVLAELNRRRQGYEQYCFTLPYQQQRIASLGMGLTSIRNATEGYYTICSGPTARSLDYSTSDLDHFESSFERDAGILSAGDYTRWRKAGEPNRWIDPTEVRHIVPARPDIDIRSIQVQRNPEACQGVSAAAMIWIDETHEFRREHQNEPVASAISEGMPSWAELMQNMGPIGMSTNSQSMRYYTLNSLGVEPPSPPATSIQEPTNE